MFPYKSFFERHSWIGYLLLTTSVIGIFFIPWFNRWLNKKEQEYNRQLQRSYKLLIINKLLLRVYPHTFINFRLQNSSEMQITLAFRDNGFAKLFANLIDEAYSTGRIAYKSENVFLHNDESFPNKVAVSRNKLNCLLKQFFAMTSEQTDLVWYGLCDTDNDLQNSNKWDIIGTYSEIAAKTSAWTYGTGLFTCDQMIYSSQYSFRLAKQQKRCFDSRNEYEVGLRCTFPDSDIAFRFVQLMAVEDMGYEEEGNGKYVVFLNKDYGLINMLLRFGIPEEQARLVTEEIFETAPKIRKSARILAQAYRTQNELFGKLSPELTIKIAAFTAPNGTNSEAAERIAANHFCKPGT